MENNTSTPKTDKSPAIEPQVLLKWGLALLGEEKAKEYLAWLFSRLPQQTPPESQVIDG